MSKHNDQFDESDEHPNTHEWQPESDGYSNWCVVCGWEYGAIELPPRESDPTP